MLKVLRRPPESAQYLSIRYSERLAANDIVASVGSRGDSYDCDDPGVLLRSA
jgi:putative transposase